MKVNHFTLLNHGGAFAAAKRLVDAQLSLGIDATLKSSQDFGIFQKARSRVQVKLDYELNRVIKPPLTISYFNSTKKIKNSEIMNLHWLPGALPYLASAIAENVPTIWTLHDTNPFTAICHNPFLCMNFTDSCSNCPQRGFIPSSIVEKKLIKKERNLNSFRNLRVVAPSKWIASLATVSGLMSNLTIHVVPNAVPLDIFTPENRDSTRRAMGLEDCFVVGFLSSELGPAKGGIRALRLFESFSSRYPGKVRGIEIGSNSKTSKSNTIPFQSHFEKEISSVLSACDVLLYTSLADNLPNTLLEAQACGVPVLSVNIGGTSECFENNVSGHLFSEDNEALAILERLFANPENRKVSSIFARDFALRNFDPSLIARRYSDIYREIS